MNFKAKSKPVQLRDCPVGLFLFDGSLGYKSEYGDNRGFVHAYCFGSGEYFWGGAKNAHDQGSLMVTPMKLKYWEGAPDDLIELID